MAKKLKLLQTFEKEIKYIYNFSKNIVEKQ